MAEDFEIQESGEFNLQQYVGVVRRRHLHFLIPLFIAWLIVWGTSWFLPPRYRSGTLILVEQPSMPRDYVVPNITDDLQQRLQSITQQIMSRTRLLHIIDQLNLYSGTHEHLSPDQKVERMRKDIDIDLVKGANNQVSAFNVYYTSGDPRTAQQATSELTNLFINENLEVRQQQSQDTTKFLEDQLETARETLASQEEKVREFKGQHVGELPAQLGSNLQILSGLQTQLQTEGDALNAARQQRVYLQTLVDQYQTMQASPKSADGTPVGLPALDAELDRLKTQLADLSSRYTDQHPDVRKLKEQIAKTEKTRDQIMVDLAKARSSAPSDGNASTTDMGSADSKELSPAMVQLRGQLHSNQAEIGNRERAIADLKVRIADYQARLNQEPIREQQLADLNRGYDQSKQSYDDLLKKKNESAMATSMELLQQGERFRILDAPSFPNKPDFPNRLKFCGIGVGVGLALGLVVAGVFEMMDDRVYEEKQLKELLAIPVISEIPDLVSTADERNRRKKIVLGWIAASFVVVTILMGSAFSYLRG
ncbi:MAG: XrtA system polysaccharide chain length determinant [Terriglobales bacterium]